MTNRQGLKDDSSVVVSEVRTKGEIQEFIDLAFRLYKGDPNFTPRLKRDQRFQFSRANPFYSHSKVKLYLAFKNGKTAGRIASIINHNHLNYHKDKTGFFGFFESINDNSVAAALFNHASSDLRRSGMELMIGPMNFSTNEECGLLIEGFDAPPLLMMPYNPPYYDHLLTAQGFTKARDLFAYLYELQDTLPDKVLRVAAIAEKRGAMVRLLNKKSLLQDMKLFQAIYNRAWSQNWCFVPITDAEIEFTVKELKMILNEDIVAIAESAGEPVGFLGVVPDFNIILRKMMGSLNPVTILKALLHKRSIHSGRLMLFGIVPEFRNKGIDALLFREVHKGLLKASMKKVEFSWILEDNLPTIRIADLFGGVLYKRYRVYQRGCNDPIQQSA